MKENLFIPVSKEDMRAKGWDRPDFVLITGDAYVDHPSFGAAVISRVLENAGYKVGIIAQPDWKNVEDFKRLGKPKLAFLITAGNIDSMVNHYSVSRKRRDKDAYSPGGQMGLRPDRATIVYSNMVRQAYKGVPVIIGGIEASLRRFAHYDYWNDKVRRSILFDCESDLLVYGMGERQILSIAENLKNGLPVEYMHHIPGTCFMVKSLENLYGYTEIPSFEEVSSDRFQYARAFKAQYEEQDSLRGKVLVQKHKDVYIVQNPPADPLNQAEIDRIYDLPYTRRIHPMYSNIGDIPAITEVKFSLISVRGCYGGCSFCALTFHQGRVIQSRSHDSIVSEAQKLIDDPEFKGYIHDVGGPTANFRHAACEKQKKFGTCKDKQCLYPKPCKNLSVDHQDYLKLLRKLRNLQGVKKVFIRSGLRFDYICADKNDDFLNELCEHHISGQLKVAPEHVSEKVLRLMKKPRKEVYQKFVDKYYKINNRLGKNQFLVPYLMSSHPGSDLEAAVEMAEYLRDIKYSPEQVQDFYPTPGTLSTCMFYTHLDPTTMKPLYVAVNSKDKAMQRALLQYRNPKNYELVKEALLKTGRQDLIGYGDKCLIRPVEKTGDRKTGQTKKPVRNNAKNNGRDSGRNSSSTGGKNRKSSKRRG